MSGVNDVSRSNLMTNKVGLIVGVANKLSIAYHIASKVQAYGATVYASYQPALESLAKPLLHDMNPLVLDVSDDKSIDALDLPELDFVVYGPAYADKSTLRGDYLNMSREYFAQALDISCYSLIPLLRKLKLKQGASILALTYHGSTKVIPCYDLMGIAKAALEANVRYLAYYLGERDIRVNALSAGPLRTLAAAKGIKGFNCLSEYYCKNAPLQKNITHEQAANSSLYLLSDMSSGVTGEIHYVDAGYSIMGVKNPRTGDVDLSEYHKA